MRNRKIISLILSLGLVISGVSIDASAKALPVKLNKSTMTIKKGKTVKLKVKKNKGVKLKSVTFKSKNKKIATVDKKTGKIVGKKAGSTKIISTVKYKIKKKVKSAKLSCSVTVEALQEVNKDELKTSPKPSTVTEPTSSPSSAEEPTDATTKSNWENGGRKAVRKVANYTETEYNENCEHEFLVGTIIEPNCTEDGLVGQVCQKCGYSPTKTQTVIPKLNHKYVGFQHSVKGISYVAYTCAECGDTYTELGELPEKEECSHYIPNGKYTYMGEIDGVLYHGIEGKCKNCGENAIVIEECNAVPHSEEATCDEAGCSYNQCSICGGVSNLVELKETGHKWGTNWTVEDPDCVNQGRRYVKCNVCGVERPDTLRIIDTIPHDYSNFYTTQEADCTHAEIGEGICSMCSELQTEITRSALGHNDNDRNGFCDTCKTECNGLFHKDSLGRWELLYTFDELIGDSEDGKPFDNYRLTVNGDTIDMISSSTKELKIDEDLLLCVPIGYNIADNLLDSIKCKSIDVRLDPKYYNAGLQGDVQYVLSTKAFEGAKTLTIWASGDETDTLGAESLVVEKQF